MSLFLRPDSKCLMIAEIGINHNGSVETAKKLINMAKKYGCDLVKFQKRDIHVVYTQKFLSEARESPWGTTQREQKEGLELSKEQYQEIDYYCKQIQIGWFASAWDFNSQASLREFNCKYNKIASAMITYPKFLEEVASERKPTFISTGMCTYTEIDQAVELFEQKRCPYTLMHTVSVYPCLEEKTNIAVMLTLRDRYKCPVGYSGHEAGVLPSMLAAAYGASAIERHITLDRAMYGSDQAASLESRGLEILVNYVRGMEIAFGNGEKTFDSEEKAVAKRLRYFEN